MVKKTFDEVVLFARTGLNPRDNFKLGNGSNKYITIKNIHNNEIIIDENTDVVDDAAIELIHKRSQIKKGDILFCSIGRMGDMYIIPDEPQGWDINESVFAFTVDTTLVRQKYFYYVFKNRDTIEYLSRNSSGSTFKSIKMNQLKKMVFDLPSLDEQDAIVGVLDNLCGIIQKREQELDELDELIKARFVEMFGEPIANPKRWPIKRLKELSSLITNGNTPKGGSENYVDKGITFLRSQNVWRNRIDLSDVAYIDENTHLSMKKSSVHHNDILITKTGRINTENSSLGRAALFTGEDNSANINGHVYLVRLEKTVDPRFVVTILTGEAYRKYIRKVCVGGIDKRQINLDQVEDFPIILPPIEEQIQFAEIARQIDKSKVVAEKNWNIHNVCLIA